MDFFDNLVKAFQASQQRSFYLNLTLTLTAIVSAGFAFWSATHSAAPQVTVQPATAQVTVQPATPQVIIQPAPAAAPKIPRGPENSYQRGARTPRLLRPYSLCCRVLCRGGLGQPV